MCVHTSFSGVCIVCVSGMCVGGWVGGVCV